MQPRTTPQALDEVATTRPEVGFTFIRDDGGEEHWAFPELNQRSRAIAVALREQGMRKGERVALVLPAPHEFVPAFLGVVQAGGVPVPLYPPMGLGKLGGYLDHAQHIVGAARASYLVTNQQIKAVLGKLHTVVPELRTMLTLGELDGDSSRFSPPDLGKDDTCFLQFTSGSTSKPKGVIVTYENLAYNCHAIMREGLNTSHEDMGVSWLPLFHDMGLIGFVLAPLYYHVPVTFIPPMLFLKRPAIWLEQLGRYSSALTYGPNFAYAITTKRVRDRDIEGLDLSGVRVAGCGAEPIQADTLRGFARRFGDYGFREEAFVPSYGMAEHTLAIAFASGIPTDVVEAERLWSEGHAEPSPDGQGIEIVGCGRAFSGHEIRVVDTETREALPERRVGEIQIRGPSRTPGYFENAEITAATIDDSGWLSTGDLGYLADGQIFICGRQKDVLIVHGRNYYPQDLEWAASSVEGIRAGNAVAFSAYREGLGREAIVVVAETKASEGHDQLAKKVRNAIQENVGVAVDEVRLLEAGAVPKTSSGKVQRSRTRQLYEEDALSRPEDEGKAQVAGRVMESQLAHLRLRILGNKKK